MEFEKLKIILSEHLKIDKEMLKLSSLLVDDLGMDSLDAFQIIMIIEEEFDIDIPGKAVEEIETIEDILVYIKNVKR